ncbi:hypothetical protein GCM10009609_05250 [Pseudonocardia aurantiaca]|uniref:Group II intron maturase-specific domain-containing protein n=1 Tax=Pseudonocardia aurantiaca TaxID=75290 RepID=A0ABW4FJK5_9PSEU
MALRGANAPAVLQRLNPIIKGWAAYYRTAASSRRFHALDTYLWTLTYKWAHYSHPNKSKRISTVHGPAATPHGRWSAIPLSTSRPCRYKWSFCPGSGSLSAERCP